MLSIEQRYNICLMAERHPKWTQLELARWAYETFQLPKIPSQGTISRLLAKRDVYMNCKDNEKAANRVRKPNNVLVRLILQEWVSQSIWNGIPINSPIIQDTAQSVWYRIPAEHREGNGSFSYKWINNFLAKMDINISNLDEELPKPPKIWTFEERNALKQIFATIPSQDIFTLDETFLAYNLPLDYAQYEASQIQRVIEVATVMLCSNVEGTEKLKPVVVGKYNSYRSFRNYFPEEPSDPISQSLLGEKMARRFGISYHSNRKSWLTSNLFHDWLARWDKRLAADNRNIWIILDDSCSHRIINPHLKNIKLVYTSANSRFLPFNWGVLDEFKTRYRIQQYQALIDLQSTLEKKTNKKLYITFEQSQLTMSNAFKFIKKAWMGIPVETIRANWKSSGILPPEMIRLDETVSMAFKKNEALEAELNSLCDKFYCKKKWDHDMLLDLNIENKNTNFLSTEELVESAIVDLVEPDPNISKRSATPTLNQITDYSNFDLLNDRNLNLSLNQAGNTADLESESDEDLSRENIVSNTSNDPHNIAMLQNPHERGNVENSYDMNLDKILDGNYTQENTDKIYNVSTLIDKPNLFTGENGVLDLRVVGIDASIVPSDYFDDMFPPAVSGSAASNIANNTTGGLNTQPRQAESSYTNTAVPVNSTAANTAPIVPFGDPALNHLLDSAVASNKEVTPPSVPDFPLESNPGATLQSNINIAKSLGNILKHTETRELSFSDAAIAEIKFNYDSLLKKIKKVRKQKHNMKTRRGQVQLDRYLGGSPSSPNSTNFSSSGNLHDSVDLQLPGNSSFF
ncbi:hypothetical protein HG536_0H03230 [Torulaspora globosa]|uniref:HTH CENPB-type domain-containing protein n=1 Tax=Torulaspora globosa TaxID=48254 RepID=A0A7G3ZN62_9SACH|nr:uncharacterized protein HG536_0H03230 [Torulaspora globosa]QLL34948.1 hypothetical protein HG536_0H03230 [Torulaspora globosa]